MDRYMVFCSQEVTAVKKVKKQTSDRSMEHGVLAVMTWSG
jgi:hypothetical protein